MSLPHHPLPATLFRVFSSLIFIMAGVGHIRAPEGIVARLQSAEIGAQIASIFPPTFLVVASGVVMLAAGLSLAAGFKTRLMSVVLILCLIPITVAVQLEPGSSGPLFKNFSIFGSLLFLATHGPVGIGIDALPAERT